MRRSLVFAGETLLTSAARLAREAAQTQVPSQTPARVATRVEKHASVLSYAAMAQAQPGLEASGMSKRKKIIIALVAGVGFAAAAYKIDHSVLDVTPSSLGTRQD
jgi:hypothetical protein